MFCERLERHFLQPRERPVLLERAVDVPDKVVGGERLHVLPPGGVRSQLLEKAHGDVQRFFVEIGEGRVSVDFASHLAVRFALQSVVPWHVFD